MLPAASLDLVSCRPGTTRRVCSGREASAAEPRGRVVAVCCSCGSLLLSTCHQVMAATSHCVSLHVPGQCLGGDALDKGSIAGAAIWRAQGSLAICFHMCRSFPPFSVHHLLAGWLATNKHTVFIYHQMCPPANPLPGHPYPFCPPRLFFKRSAWLASWGGCSHKSGV